MTHTCKVCGVTSDTASFYKSINSRCKKCHKEKVRENRAANAEYYRTYDAWRYRNDPKVKKRHRKYQATDSGKEAARRAAERYRKENEDKIAAHTILNNAVRDKRIMKPKVCQRCGKGGCTIHGHHDDYTRPLDVKWVCQTCHVAIHREEDERLAKRDADARSFDNTPKPRGRHVRLEVK